jgi:hypothetical protein
MKKPNSEIVFHNSSSRETQIWFMDGGKIAKRRTVKAAGGSPIFVGVPWKIVGAGDFKFGGGLTPNGGADILWVNTLNQQTQIWTMDGDRIIDKAPIISEEKNGRNNMTVGPPWQIIGLGDFKGDGGTDILFRNTADNATQIWFMDGGQITFRQSLLAEDGRTPMTIGPPWEVIGIGDFNKDGGADILFRNTVDNATQVWLMDGHRVRDRPPLLSEDGRTHMKIGPPWEVIGVGDFNQDGGADILFRNTVDNHTQVWLMDGHKIHDRPSPSLVSEDGRTPMKIGPPWEVVGIGMAPPSVTDPATVQIPFIFRVNTVEVRTQKSDNDHSDSDWLSFIISIGNPTTKNVRTFSETPHNIAGNVKSGGMVGGGSTQPLVVEDNEIVTITYLIMNLGSSDAEEQFAQAVKVTNKVVQIAAPIIGAAIGLYLGDPKQGFEVGKKIAVAVGDAVAGLSDVFDFLGIHFGPPNCNGEVLRDTLVYQPGEFARAAGQPASREYTGPQLNERCGGAPVTRVNFEVIRVPAIGFLPPADP